MDGKGKSAILTKLLTFVKKAGIHEPRVCLLHNRYPRSNYKYAFPAAQIPTTTLKSQTTEMTTAVQATVDTATTEPTRNETHSSVSCLPCQSALCEYATNSYSASHGN